MSASEGSNVRRGETQRRVPGFGEGVRFSNRVVGGPAHVSAKAGRRPREEQPRKRNGRSKGPGAAARLTCSDKKKGAGAGAKALGQWHV